VDARGRHAGRAADELQQPVGERRARVDFVQLLRGRARGREPARRGRHAGRKQRLPGARRRGARVYTHIHLKTGQ